MTRKLKDDGHVLDMIERGRDLRRLVEIERLARDYKAKLTELEAEVKAIMSKYDLEDKA